MTIDPTTYPRAAAYLAGLPAGVESYPECRVRVDGRQNLREDFGELVDTQLPGVIRDFLTGAHTADWMPEVISVAVLAMARDRFLPNDEALREWTYQDAISVFNQPLFRMLMFVMSPTLVVMGAAKRWSTWRTGSSLTAQPVHEHAGRLSTRISLSHPRDLYDDVSRIQLGQVFIASVDSSGGKNGKLALERFTPTEMQYLVSWDA